MFCYCYQFSFPNSLHEYTPRELFPANELYLFSHEKYSMLFTATFSHGFSSCSNANFELYFTF